MPRKTKKLATLAAARKSRSESKNLTPNGNPVFPLSTRSRSRSISPRSRPRPLTASERKMKKYTSRSRSPSSSSSSSRSRSHSPVVTENPCSRTIIEIPMLLQLISSLRCPQLGCGSQVEGRVNWKKCKGFSICLQVYCPVCDTIVQQMFTSSVDETSTAAPPPYTVNKLMTVAALRSDMGSYKLSMFCEVLDMPSLHQKTFNKKAKQVFSESDKVRKEVFAKAAKTVRREYARETGTDPDPETPLDIAVSFDGSWMTRGHSSLIGIGCVIDTLTGLVLDAHVLSQHCQTCATSGEWVKKNTPHRYERWLTQHRQEGCLVNYKGSSGMMEPEAAEVLWKRSMELHNMKYTIFVGDGDSKAHDRVVREQPYGQEVEIQKEECMNHVEKRIGTALRNLVQDCKKKGITLGGRQPGSLTDAAIKKLTTYYGRAILDNNTVEDMQKAIWATLYHCYSTDDNPRHQFCPQGENSWCFFKIAVARKEFPGDHSNHVHTKLDYKRLHTHIKPVYERLSHPDLLQRCLGHKTQNANESLHNTIWSKCSKSKCHSHDRVEFSMLSGIAEFNFGPSSLSHIEEEVYKIASGPSTHRLRAARSRKRLQKSKDVAKGKEKARKKKRTEAVKRREADTLRDYGDTGYGAGRY